MKVLPPFWFLLALAVAALLQWRFPTPPLETGPAGIVLAVLGIGLIVWAIMSLRRAGEDPDPRTPTQRIVATGPYQLGRNPIYLGMILATIGLGLAWGTLWSIVTTAAVFPVIHRIVATEERQLASMSGYPEYKARVRRWF